MREILDDTQLSAAVKMLPNWKLEHGELIRSITLGDFKQAMDFVNQVAALAENANHHPDIDIRYNCVRLGLVTHDAGGITQRDIDLAAEVDLIM